MTYLKFYQAWLELVAQNNKIIMQSEPNFFCWNQLQILVDIFFGIVIIIIFIKLVKNKLSLISSMAFVMVCLIGSLYLSNRIFAFEETYPECKTALFIDNSNSWTIYPEKDYTVAEFQENMTRIGQKASPEQIELAKTVLKDCLKNLPSDYQVNHSSIIRRCIADEDIQSVFEKKDAETYKNKLN